MNSLFSRNSIRQMAGGWYFEKAFLEKLVNIRFSENGTGDSYSSFSNVWQCDRNKNKWISSNKEKRALILFIYLETFFFYLGFLSQTFHDHSFKTAGKGEGYFFNSSLTLPPASWRLINYSAITEESSFLHIASS